MKEKFLVTSALPYANGPIHLGHIAGAYLPADIFVRFQRMLENDIIFVCGTDEHGVPITLKAEQEGVTPRVIVERYHENIKLAFERLGISFDNFSGTSQIHNKYHATLAREFFSELYKNNYISSKLSDQHYCTKCNRFLPDRFIQGTCPHCGYEEARGDECPQCNHPFDPIELKNVKCKLCGEVPEVRATKHWYLRLDLLQKQLQEWITSKPYWKENVVNFVKGSWFNRGLKERAITRDLYWGVPVPLDEAAGKVLYVWFDAPIGYISSTMQWAENQGTPDKWKEYWQDPNCKVLHFIGKDNIPFHAIIWPGILMGLTTKYQLPWNVPANEYLTFGSSGEKASKSKGNVVWVHESLDNFSPDLIRYYLAANAPEKTDTAFTWKDFQKKCNSELLGVLGNFANRALKFIEKNFNSTVPEAKDLQDIDKEILSTLQTTIDNVKKCYSNFEVRNAVANIVELGRLGNQYFDTKAPWKSYKEDMEDCARCMYISIQIVKTIAVLLAPVIPNFSQTLWKQLGQTDTITTWNQVNMEIKAGQTIKDPKGIIEKVEDSKIAPLEEKLNAATSHDVQKAEETATSNNATEEKKAEETATSNNATEEKKELEFPPFKETVTIDDFDKLDIRMGTIVAAQRVPRAKKLLQLQINIGNETRQIVSGIAKYYEPEQIIGKTVPVIVNLKPVVLCGVESKGMVLCASHNGAPHLLHADADVMAGIPVC